MNLADLIARNAAFAPSKAALRFEGAVLSYAGFSARIDAVARLLFERYGVRRGDRVAVLALNGPDTLVLLYACARLGAMLAPLNWRLAEPELAWILDDAGPALLAADATQLATARALVARRPGLPLLDLGAGLEEEAGQGATAAEGAMSDPLLLVYTSGTTGRPKGAVLTQAALAANAIMSWHMHGLTVADHVLAVLPFFHVGGLNIQTTPALHAGATVTIHARFDPTATLAAIEADRPTVTVLVPATMDALLAAPDFADADLSSLRVLTTGSTYVPQPLADAFEKRSVPVLQVYGATETAPIAVYTRAGGVRPPGATGWPGLLCEAIVADEGGQEVPHGTAGEVLVRGPQLLAGYWRNEAATAAAFAPGGWFRTGDIATRSADGAFTVHDRKKNMIISGGENVYPAEVERVLLAHPEVAEAAVVGRPDPRWGEAPVAFVVPRTGADGLAERLHGHVRAELARYKAPRDYVFVPDLPRSALGKVQHYLLREG